MDPRNLVPLCPLAFTQSDEPCPHAWDDGSLAVPTPASTVHKQECGYCFNTNEHHEGTFVCMKCFQGMCGAHVTKHHELTGHPLYFRIKHTYVKAEQPANVEQLGVEAPPDVETSVVCLPCRQELVEGSGLTAEVCIGIHAANAPQVVDNIAANNALMNVSHCKHCDPGAITQVPEAERKFKPGCPPQVSQPCDQQGCDVALNNWMCLTCGFIGCPRAEAGGQQHAILHFMMTNHPLVVKLGTVTPNGADVHCYACDDEVAPKDLRKLLQGLGIDQTSSVKTAKSLSEMMVDQSLKFDYNSITEAGKDLTPVFGPHLTGLKNFGNTCYMASVLQCLAAVPAFQQRFVAGPLADHQAQCRASDPHECPQCQLEKLFKGIASGAFSLERQREQDHERLNGVTPRDFKKLFCKGHPEYSTGQQQDAAEFMGWLLVQLGRRERAVVQQVGAELASAGAANPGNALEFVTSERTECSGCGGCKFQEAVHNILQLPIPVKPFVPPLGPDGQPVSQTDEEKDATRPRTTLDECLSNWMMPSGVDCRCEHCNNTNVTYATSARLKTMPDVLAIHVMRYYLDHTTYQTKKLDCYVDVPDVLDLERVRAQAPQASDNVWSTTRIGLDAGGSAPQNDSKPVEVDEIALATVMSLGIDLDGAKWALQKTDNNVERAVEYYFSHQGECPPAGSADAADSATGAPEAAAQDDFAVPDGPGKYELFGLISHIGHSALTGHYVAHIKKDGRWVIFNDEKVAESVDPPKRHATVYLYRRLA